MPKRKTDAEFKAEVKALVGDEYTFLEPYKGCNTKTKVRHNKCSFEYSVAPTAFLRGTRCPKCYGTHKRTDAEFLAEVKSLVGDEYTFLEPYKNTDAKIKVKHNKCGHLYKVTPADFLRGNRCPKCAHKKRRKTNEKFKAEVKALAGDEYTFLEPYKNSSSKIKVKHNKCGHLYKVTPADFLRGHRCPICRHIEQSKKHRKTEEEFKAEVKALAGDEYTFLEPYKNAKTKIKVRHNKCGHVYKATPSDFLCGKRCPKCYGIHKKTDAEFLAEVKSLVGNEYTFLELYKNSSSKIKVKHNKCGHLYKVTPADFLRGHRCPICRHIEQSQKQKKTDTEFKAKVKALVGDQHTFLEPYKNAKTKIKVRHNKCGHVYKVKPNNFFSGRRCAFCKHNHKMSFREFKAIFNDEFSHRFTYIEGFKSKTNPIKLRCKKCKNTFSRSFYLLQVNQECPYCNEGAASRTKIKNNKTKFRITFKEHFENRFIICSNYKNGQTKIAIFCKDCGHLFWMTPCDFKSGHRCLFCSQTSRNLKKTKSQAKFEKEFKKRFGNDYKALEKYKGDGINMKLLHIKCGKTFYAKPTNFLHKTGCPYCKFNGSKGELAVSSYLQSHKIKYKYQFSIHSCRDIHALPFDFAVLNKKNEIEFLIEYQGWQHFINPFRYRKQKGVFNQQSVLSTQKHDAIKLQYCKEHNIKLIRINHPETSSKSNTMKFIKRLVKRTLDKELKVS